MSTPKRGWSAFEQKMETTMSIRGRVGRHTNARGKQCQNWENDQRTVIDLLNLDILRRNVLNLDILKGKWPPGDVIEMAKLASMAVDHIDRLKRGVDQLKDDACPSRSEPLDKLPWWAELFGRAYVTKAETESTSTWSPLFPSMSPRKPYMYARDGAGNKHKVSAEMKYGSPLTWTDAIRTWTLPGLILFQDGLCAFVPPNVQLGVAEAHEMPNMGGRKRSAPHELETPAVAVCPLNQAARKDKPSPIWRIKSLAD